MELTPRKIKEGKWFWTSNLLYDKLECSKGRKPYLIAVYSYLCRCANENQICWPTQIDIAQKTGMSTRMVRGVIKELFARGLISIRRHNRFGKTKNTYLLTSPRKWLLSQAQYAARRRHSVPPNKTHKNNKNIFIKEMQEMRAGLTSKWTLPSRSP